MFVEGTQAEVGDKRPRELEVIQAIRRSAGCSRELPALERRLSFDTEARVTGFDRLEGSELLLEPAVLN